MPTFFHGKGTRVIYGAYELSPYFRTANNPATADVAETSAFGTTYKTYVIGEMGSTIELEGMYDGVTLATAGGAGQILTAAFGQDVETPAVIAFEGLGAGTTCKVAKTKETAFNVSSSVGDMVALTASLQVTAVNGWGVVLQSPSAPVNSGANGNSTGVLQYDSSTTSIYPASVEAEATLHVLASAITGGTLGFKIQSSPDDVTYTDLVGMAFPDAVGGSVLSSSVRSNGRITVNKYVRVAWTRTSSPTGNVTVLVTFAKSAN